MGKVAQVRTRKRGKTFSYIFEAGKTAAGKRKVVEKGGFPSKDAAYKAGVSAYNDWLHGNIGITSEKVTLGEFLANWLANVAAPNIKPTTLQRYQSVVRVHILPMLAAVKIQELTPAMLDKWIRNLQSGGLAFKTLTVVRIIFHHALNYAVYPAQLISSNPLNYVKVPKGAPRNVVKRTIISNEKFSEVMQMYPFGTPFHIPLMLLYHTGMRIGEVVGLMWRDIDFAEKKITVRQQVVYLSRRGHFLATLKTEASNRYLFIDDTLAAELKAWQNQQLINEQKFGKSYVYGYCEADGHLVWQSKAQPLEAERVHFVCVRPNGKLCFTYSVVDSLVQFGLNSHSFRHTHATRLIESGALSKSVSGRLGHASTETTQDLYTHNTEKMQRDLVSIVKKVVQTNT